MLMKYRLFTPGPTSVPEATLLELAKPVHHHRTGEFRAMFNEVQELLQYVFQTKTTVYTITGSGTAAAEAGIVNALSPGQKALCVVNGKFAERWRQVCGVYGIEHKDLKLEYGEHATPELIANELKAAKYDAVILVHSETSTGDGVRPGRHRQSRSRLRRHAADRRWHHQPRRPAVQDG